MLCLTQKPQQVASQDRLFISIRYCGLQNLAQSRCSILQWRTASKEELLRAAFPAASITGAPKIQAIRVAMQEEAQQRGPCMGAIGWIALDGRMEMSVAIRTAFLMDGRVRYYAGCGITADSIPHDEFMESRHKAAAFIRALGLESDSRE